MLANPELINKTVHCCICTDVIPVDRIRSNRKSVTCSDGCSTVRRSLLRKKTDDEYCRYCGKASTPAARLMYSRFRQWMKLNPDQAMPELWPLVEAAGMTKPQFAAALLQAEKLAYILDPYYADKGWGSLKTPKPEAKPTPELDRVLDLLRAQAAAGRQGDASAA